MPKVESNDIHSIQPFDALEWSAASSGNGIVCQKIRRVCVRGMSQGLDLLCSRALEEVAIRWPRIEGGQELSHQQVTEVNFGLGVDNAEKGMKCRTAPVRWLPPIAGARPLAVGDCVVKL